MLTKKLWGLLCFEPACRKAANGRESGVVFRAKKTKPSISAAKGAQTITEARGLQPQNERKKIENNEEK